MVNTEVCKSVEVRGQFIEVSSVLSVCGFQGLNSDSWA